MSQDLVPLTHLVALEYGGSENFNYARPELFFGPTTGSPYPGYGSTILLRMT